ncbi:hypothetical protein ACHAPT_013421 [Fusarium lateritium]
MTFGVAGLETLHRLTVSQPPPFLGKIRHLQASIQLPVQWHYRSIIESYRAYAAMARWRQCCQALESLVADQTLVWVNLWLDTCSAAWRATLSSPPRDEANPFIFGERLAAVLTVCLPVNPDRPEAWQEVSDTRPQFTILPRGWPPYRPEFGTTMPYLITELWESAEPGVVETSQVVTTH